MKKHFNIDLEVEISLQSEINYIDKYTQDYI